MHARRFWGWVVGASLAVILLPGTPSATAATRAVLVVHSGDYAELEHVRAELQAMDFRVTLLNHHQPRSSPAQLIESAHETGASVAIEFAVVSDTLQVWLFDAATGKAPSLQVFRYAAMSDELGRVEALRVVEYLRAALSRSEVEARQEEQIHTSNDQPVQPVAIDPKAPQKVPPPRGRRDKPASAAAGRADSTVLPLLQASSGSLARPPSLWLTLAPGFIALNRLNVVAPIGVAGVVWQAVPQIAVTARGLLPLSTSDIASAMTATELQAWAIWGTAQYDFLSKDGRWHPFVGVGLAQFWLDLFGPPVTNGKKRLHTKVVVPAPAAELGVRWQARGSLALCASLFATYTVSPYTAEFRGHDVATTLGRPAIFWGTLGVEWRAVAWGMRD